ncbi:MAG: IMP cyclohydrolase [Oscillospiraceae bacterium]
METYNIDNLLKNNDYPGRGIIIGRSACGKKAYIVYFIMGRSENSRNRIFTQTGDGIRTEAFDPSKLTDPSLIIYRPVRKAGEITVVTNGDQTDTIVEALSRGHSYIHALLTRTFEPDCPNWTPRISGIVQPNGDYRLSILKSANGDCESVRRYFFEYNSPKAGAGHFIHTYKCDGNPIPSFEGEPEEINISGSIDEFADLVWNSLNENNRVSLFARSIDIESGSEENVIINKNRQAK